MKTERMSVLDVFDAWKAANLSGDPMELRSALARWAMLAQPVPNAGEARLRLDEHDKTCIQINTDSILCSRGWNCARREMLLSALAASAPAGKEGAASPRPVGHEESQRQIGNNWDWQCSCGWHGDNLFEHWKEVKVAAKEAGGGGRNEEVSMEIKHFGIGEGAKVTPTQSSVALAHSSFATAPSTRETELREALEKTVERLKSEMDKGRFDYVSNSSVLRTCCKELIEAFDRITLAPDKPQPPAPEQGTGEGETKR